MSIRLFCRQTSIGKDFVTLPNLAKNLSVFGKHFSIQPQGCSNEASAWDRKMNIQVTLSQSGETKRVEILGLENLKKSEVSGVVKSITQAINSKADQAHEEGEVFSKPRKMSFDEFLKSDFIESYEKYKEDPNTSILIGNEEEKVKDAYERYCIAAFGDYIDSVEGSCPFTAL